jgi:hypothetical protein
VSEVVVGCVVGAESEADAANAAMGMCLSCVDLSNVIFVLSDALEWRSTVSRRSFIVHEGDRLPALTFVTKDLPGSGRVVPVNPYSTVVRNE